ncbi:MAG TPA: protein-methionine-sulfoxide reductase heme-binding subunit MsrQ [Gammaproteobacteria bacterium]
MPPYEGSQQAAASRAGAAPSFRLLPRDRIAVAKIFIAAACLVPFAIVVAKIAALIPFGANPVEEVLHSMGKTGLQLLWITLAITPLRKLTKLNWLLRLRRMLGLFAFFYLSMHLLVYAVLDRQLNFDELIVDLTERPYIIVGMLCFTLLVPLAVTSTRGWQRRLGRKWTTLHRLIYPAAILGVLHYWWLVKADIRDPLFYAVLLGLLLGFRVVDSRVRAARRRRSAADLAAARGGQLVGGAGPSSLR